MREAPFCHFFNIRTLAIERAPTSVNVLSLILMTRRFGLCVNASASAVMPT